MEWVATLPWNRWQLSPGIRKRETRRRGLSCSISEMLERLGRIREVGVVYPSPGKRRAPTVQMTVSQMTDDQRALYDALDLRRYLAA